MRESEQMMKKIINMPGDVVRECAEGFAAAYGGQYELLKEAAGIRVRDVKDKTALVIGGGSGHEPMFEFFLGENLGDAAACGNIFTSPDPGTIYQTAMSVERGKGVLFVYGNYTGDNMNFDMAAELMADAGVESRTVRVRDDIASAPRDRLYDRRGIAGDFFVIRIAGAATGAGLSLEEAYRVTEKANENTYTIGVGLSGATIPGEREPIFTLPEDEMEFGLGIHGEPGVKRVKLMPADDLVDELYRQLLEDSALKAGDEVCSYINGLGSTTLMELCIMNRRLKQLLDRDGIRIHDMEVNSLVTTQEMAGASITLMRVDDELKRYYDQPCSCPYYTKKRLQVDAGQRSMPS